MNKERMNTGRKSLRGGRCRERRGRGGGEGGRVEEEEEAEDADLAALAVVLILAREALVSESLQGLP